MQKPDDLLRLRHMVDSAQELKALCKGKTKRDFFKDRKLNLAAVRLLEIIGEAANKVTPDFQITHPAIPWPEVISMRNRLIHGYESVDLNIVWQIIRSDIPKLISAVESVLKEKTR